MSGRHSKHGREALSRLPTLDLGELRERWCQLYKTETTPRLSRELLMRAIAYRMQEVASGGPRLELQRQLRQIGLELQQTGQVRIRPHLKPGTRLLRDWRGRNHEVLVLDDGFLWEGTHHRSLSAIARQITGTAWSGPLFFGLRSNRSASCPRPKASVPVDPLTEAHDAAG
jgi:hypothetical protein